MSSPVPQPKSTIVSAPISVANERVEVGLLARTVRVDGVVDRDEARIVELGNHAFTYRVT